MKPLVFDEPIMSIVFHPSKNLLITGLIDGSLITTAFTEEKLEVFNVLSPKNRRFPFKTQWTQRTHEASIRSLVFSQDQSHIFSVSLDKSITLTDLETGKPVETIKEAHFSPINKIELMSTAENNRQFVTGDDDGMIRIWDLRDSSCLADGKPIMQFHDHIDYISDLLVMPHKKLLASCSGDGYLHIYDTRKQKLKASSDPKESELLNMASFKENHYVAVGLLDGAIDIYSYNYWASPVDRFIGHPSSIDAMLPLHLTQSTVPSAKNLLLTGGGDGIIRLISLMPNQFIGVVANMNIQGKGFSYIEDETKELPISCLGLSHNHTWLAASSYHENIVYFWNDHVKLLNTEAVAQNTSEKNGYDMDVESIVTDSEEEKIPHKKRRKKQRKAANLVVFQEKRSTLTESFFKNID